jgi:guanylate kinase
MTELPASASSRQKPGLLFVLSAPSGAGKDSVIQRLKDQGWPIHVAVTVTTRPPRANEREGVHYFFRSPEEFARMRDAGELLEYALVHEHWYGVPRMPARELLASGQDVLLKIDVQGAATVHRKVPDAVFIFLAPESFEELEQRLLARSQATAETSAEREVRLHDASYELAQQSWYDYLVVNRAGHLDKAVEQVKAIIIAEHCRVRPRNIVL